MTPTGCVTTMEICARTHTHRVVRGSVHGACAVVREQYLGLLLSQSNRKLHLFTHRYDVGAYVTHRDRQCCKRDKRAVSETNQSHFQMHKTAFVYVFLFIYFDRFLFFLQGKPQVSSSRWILDLMGRLIQAVICHSTSAHETVTSECLA